MAPLSRGCNNNNNNKALEVRCLHSSSRRTYPLISKATSSKDHRGNKTIRTSRDSRVNPKDSKASNNRRAKKVTREARRAVGVDINNNSNSSSKEEAGKDNKEIGAKMRVKEEEEEKKAAEEGAKDPIGNKEEGAAAEVIGNKEGIGKEAVEDKKGSSSSRGKRRMSPCHLRSIKLC